MKRRIDLYSKEELEAMNEKAVKRHTEKAYKLTQLHRQKLKHEQKACELSKEITSIEVEMRQLASDIWTYEEKLKELNTPVSHP